MRDPVWKMNSHDLGRIVRSGFEIGMNHEAQEDALNELVARARNLVTNHGDVASRAPEVAPDIESIRSDEAVRDAFVECYTLQSIISEGGPASMNVSLQQLLDWDRLESDLIRAILAKAEVAPPPTERLYEIAEQVRKAGSLDNAVSHLRGVSGLGEPPVKKFTDCNCGGFLHDPDCPVGFPQPKSGLGEPTP